ncbi:hypothetical protein [Marinicrinis sediminis]|uniref:Uncharacterized protein n=1 Tax=Marinicrinis sediminis TaxID=1652465 RepID=A0ABW5RGT9_9BACL
MRTLIRTTSLRLIISMLLLILMSAACLSGCGYTKNFEQSDYNAGGGIPAREKDPYNRAYGFTIQNERYDHHGNTHAALSQKAANQVMKIPGIAHAYVFITDRNAYAAIVLNHAATGVNSDGNRRSDTTNVGNSEGVYNIRNGGSYLNPRKLVGDSNSYYTLNKPADISHVLKQRVAIAIRNAQPYVQEVFISANRDFVNEANVYAQKTWLGEQTDLNMNRFNQWVRSQFKQSETQ